MFNIKISAVIIIQLSCYYLSAKEAEISWTGETSGTIIYPADEYAAEEYKYNFADIKFKFNNNETGKSETVVINKNLASNILQDFSKAQKNIILRENFL